MENHLWMGGGWAVNGEINEQPEDAPPLLAKLQDGRDIPIEACSCAHCDNEWFMAAYSREWMPSFCPYCGTKFIGRTIAGEPDSFLPQE